MPDSSSLQTPTDGDADLSRTYVLVVVIEAIVIAALVVLGRLFS